MKDVARAASLIFGFIAGGVCATDTSLLIPAGSYRAPYSKPSSPAETINRFRLDATPVTQAQFAAFIQSHSEWQPHNIPSLFAEQGYLKNRPSISNKTPVTYPRVQLGNAKLTKPAT
jgi:formylglycine-generating enzyme required for sulfatase activity